MAKEYPLHPVPREVFHAGDTVFIAAGGPSLRGFDWERLAQKKVIAVNRSLEKCPNAQVLWWSDDRFWEENKDAICAHSAKVKCTAYSDHVRFTYPENIYTYKFSRMRGFDDTVSGLCHGNNGGYAAINLAVKLGARRLALLGYDFRYDDSLRTHWHDGYYLDNGHKRDHREETLTKKMLPNFDSLEIPLLQKGVCVYNANTDSNLNVWPKITIEKALALAE